MSYPGNPNLADDVQRRVLSTFESMLREVTQGNHQEALLGCSLIERMDPGFRPVAELRSRLEGADGDTVVVDDLAQALDIQLPRDETDGTGPETVTPAVGGAPTPTAPAEDPSGTEPPSVEQDESEKKADGAGDDTSGGETAEPMMEPHSVGDEPIETVETEAFEDTGERIDVMSDEEMREFMAERAEPEESETGDDAADASADTTRDESVDQPDAAPDAESEGHDSATPQPPAPEPVETPVEPAAAAPGEPPGPTSAEPESDDRVAALLQEGQAAFDAGEYQTAIDSWSRVFLIDLDHAEASEKVEEARRLLAEREREAEELFHAALEKLEGGDTAGARASLEAALERKPGHVAAREHLDRLQAGALGSGAAPHGPASTGPSQPPAGDLSAEPQVPIPPPDSIPTASAIGDFDLEQSAEATTVSIDSPARKPRLSRQFLALAALGIVVVLATAWFLYSRRDSVFPNATETADTAPAHPIDRAQRLHASGRADAAMAALERVQPTDARHSEAQTLLERWRQEAATALADAQQENAEQSAEHAAERAELIAAARGAFDAGLPHKALAPLKQAEEIAALSGNEAALREVAREQMRPYTDAYLAYLDGDYRTAIRPLWDRLRESPDDVIARDLLVSSQFNLARSLLVGGNPSDAATMLSEAAKLVPRDQQVQQALRFAEHYVGIPRDLRYRIFIKHMPTR